MDESVIFSKEEKPVQKQEMPSAVPEKVVSQPTENVTTPPVEAEVSSGIKGKIIKILGAIIVLLLVGFGIFKFIVPIFVNNNEQVTITYWGLWEEKSVMDTIIREFEAKNPTIKIVYAKQDIKKYRERLQTRNANSTGPDVFKFHNTWLSMLQSDLMPLPKDVITAEEYQNVYFPVARTDLTHNGAIYGLPASIDTITLFTNTEILDAAGISAPTNWNEFIAAAKTLTVKDQEGRIKTAGAAIGTFDNITHASDIISLLLVQNGTELTNLTATSENAANALLFYTSFATGADNVWDETLDPSIIAFAKGNLAMYFGYSWDIFQMKAINPNLTFTTHQVPSLSGRGQTVASYWANGISSKSKNQKEAVLFMKYLAQKETQQKLFTESSKTRLFGELYGRMDLAETLKDNTLLYPFVLQGKTAVSTYFASDTHDDGINSQMNAYLGNAIRGVLSNTSPESAVETLAQGVAQVLNQYGQQ